MSTETKEVNQGPENNKPRVGLSQHWPQGCVCTAVHLRRPVTAARGPGCQCCPCVCRDAAARPGASEKRSIPRRQGPGSRPHRHLHSHEAQWEGAQVAHLCSDLPLGCPVLGLRLATAAPTCSTGSLRPPPMPLQTPTTHKNTLSLGLVLPEVGTWPWAGANSRARLGPIFPGDGSCP